MTTTLTRFAIGTHVDPRVTELEELAVSEGVKLPYRAELIVWLEERGCIVNLLTGKATLPHVGLPTPSGKAVSHLLTPTLTEAEMVAELEDLREGMADDAYHASGAW